MNIFIAPRTENDSIATEMKTPQLLKNKSLIAFPVSLALICFAAAAYADNEGGDHEDGKSSSSKYTPDLIVSGSESDSASSFKGAVSESFDGLSAGVHNNVDWNGVGSIDSLKLVKGSGGTYSEFSGADGGRQSATLSLGKNSSYFGFDLISAKKGGNVDFYNGNTHVGSLSISDLESKGFKSGFVNFTGDANTSWNKIVFSNGEDAGFDTKNWTSRVDGWNPSVDGTLPGTPLVEVKNGFSSFVTKVSASFATSAPGAPTPPITACLAFAGVILLQALRRKSVA